MASRFLTPFSGRGLLSRDPFLDLHREVNRLFDDSLRGMTGGTQGAMLSPSIDVVETDDGLEITAELPGVDQEDIDLRLEGDLLTISGEKRNERNDENSRFVERSYGTFTRSFTLPFTPDSDKVQADCDKGVLTIKLPRSAEQNRSKRIAIGSAGGKTIEGGSTSDQPAVGKDWLKGSEAGNKESDLSKEQAEKGKGAPA